MKDEAYKITEDVLNTILPEAFAVVKETAKRFTKNTQITVTANEFDRSISANKAYVSLEGDQATWANSWDAAGKAITWDMCIMMCNLLVVLLCTKVKSQKCKRVKVKR